MAIKPLPSPPADSPAPFDLPDVAAIQAVYRGEATADQQKRAMDWIIKGAAQIGGQSYRAGDSHATAFVEGRRFVGAQILSLLEMSMEQLRKKATQ
jgi:hypothetical protein